MVRSRDRMDVGFISTCEIRALHYCVRSFSVGTKYSDFLVSRHDLTVSLSRYVGGKKLFLKNA